MRYQGGGRREEEEQERGAERRRDGRRKRNTGAIHRHVTNTNLPNRQIYAFYGRHSLRRIRRREVQLEHMRLVSNVAHGKMFKGLLAQPDVSEYVDTKEAEGVRRGEGGNGGGETRRDRSERRKETYDVTC
jgi:hypothetical protein